MPDFKIPHESVLVNEVLKAFESCKLLGFMDGTVGAGGHAEAILQVHPEIEYFLGIDQDVTALTLAEKRLKRWEKKVILRHGNFIEFENFFNQSPLQQLNGILIDLGVSSMQLDEPERGFSFSKLGPLDMRMNQQNDLTAADIVNQYSEEDLGRIFREYGEEKKWRRAAQAIVSSRKAKPIRTTEDLVQVLKPIFAWNPKKGINPLTLIFQALRISVNKELEVLEVFLDKVIESLAPNGRLGVISFHSLEDRIVKNKMRLAASDKWETQGIGGMFRNKIPLGTVITSKPLVATAEEVKANPRSRSAKFRVFEKKG